MITRKVFLINFQSLYIILNEISDLIQYEFIAINKNDFTKLENNKTETIEGYIFIVQNENIIKNSKILLKNNYLVLNKTPIQLIKFIEKLNILFLNINYKNNSNIYINDYVINTNNKTIFKNNLSLKLTEKELKLLKFLNLKKNYPQNIQSLENEIWKYTQDLETHTVETHIYRLRKKIEEKFLDYNFIKSNKLGYYL
jgi:hypothetical protein